MFRHRDKPARKMAPPQVLEAWLTELGSSSLVQRQRARGHLVQAGPAAVPELVGLLRQGNGYARLEAARAMMEIQEPSAAPALVESLRDEDVGVRWAAREALIALEEAGLEPLLRALVGRSDSIWLREGARHILCVLKDRGCLTDAFIQVLNSLDWPEPEVRVPCAAATAWETEFGSK